MDTTEIINTIGIPHPKLYYLEKKGYIKPKKTLLSYKKRREYSQEDVEKVRLIWKYLKKGFKYNAAYEKAIAQLKISQ